MTVSWHAASYNWVGLEVYCDDVYLYIYIHIMICIYIYITFEKVSKSAMLVPA